MSTIFLTKTVLKKKDEPKIEHEILTILSQSQETLGEDRTHPKYPDSPSQASTLFYIKKNYAKTGKLVRVLDHSPVGL